MVLKVASSFLHALPHAAEDRILIAHSVGIAARVVLDPSGRHAVIACAGAGVVLVDIEKRMSVSVSLPSGGHPVWCAVHPEHPLAAVFARNLQVIEFSKKKPVVYTSTFSSNTKLGGEFTPDGKWLLFADTDRIYGMNVRSRIIRTISTGAGGTENQPLRLSFDGRSALIEREGAVVEFDVDALVAEIAAGPEVGRCYKLAEATADNE